MSELHLEYEEGLDSLGWEGMVFFKFLSLFHVKNTTVTFGHVSDSTVDAETAGKFRAYLKEQKEWVRLHWKDARACREMKQRMWWVVQKMLDFKIFSSSDQKYVMFWHDSCDDQLSL